MSLSQEFESIWDAIEPTAGAASVMKIRYIIMSAMIKKCRAWNISRSVASKTLNIDVLRYDQLLAGDIASFNIDELVELSLRLGLNVHVEVLGA
ncbi:XRE family transcriptional regulator [Pseudomonas yamanorum]|uniref:XRE family transcriptional regulator n=1 Tax=Pseudomonas yamanorum TaxID=515393 RepID=A0ABU1CVR0_9PSED|nr:XRE family transcriptional regulator [Pseudomonas yamanorum]MDR0191359.1 XRE family transcriptional regulator [Pseudomonas yamanorum]